MTEVAADVTSDDVLVTMETGLLAMTNGVTFATDSFLDWSVEVASATVFEVIGN